MYSLSEQRPYHNSSRLGNDLAIICNHWRLAKRMNVCEFPRGTATNALVLFQLIWDFDCFVSIKYQRYCV